VHPEIDSAVDPGQTVRVGAALAMRARLRNAETKPEALCLSCRRPKNPYGNIALLWRLDTS
jgi:hypothetical protein